MTQRWEGVAPPFSVLYSLTLCYPLSVPNGTVLVCGGAATALSPVSFALPLSQNAKLT